jgi:hypothetical protein
MMRAVRRTVAATVILLVPVVGVALPRPVQRDPFRSFGSAGVVEGKWIDTIIKIDRGGVVDLNLGSGDVVVTGWSRDEIRVRAAAESGTVRLHVTSLFAALRAVPGPSGGSSAVRYEVSVPANVRVLVRTGKGTVIAKGIGGDCEIRAGDGDIQVNDIGGLVVAELMSGEFIGTSLSGGVRIDAIAADVEIIGAAGEIVIDNTSGETRVSDAKSSSVRVQSVSGDIHFQGTIERNGRYRLGSHSGTVSVGIPEGGGALVSLASHNGTIDTGKLPITLQPSSRGNPEKRLLGHIGDGSARLEIETFSGSIVIRGPGRQRED